MTTTYWELNKDKINDKRRQDYHLHANHIRNKVSLYKKTKAGKEKYKKQKLRSRYKLSNDTLQKMIISQQSKCAICDKEAKFGRYGLVVDHCHITGQVRGLLCNTCNSGIGMLKDSLDLVYKAADYLVRSGSAPKIK